MKWFSSSPAAALRCGGRVALFFAACVLLFAAPLPARADFLQPMFKFLTEQETVAQLLPNAEVLTRREVELTSKQAATLGRLKNWDTNEVHYTMFHARNKERKILRTLVLWPENTPQGIIKIAVAVESDGRVGDARIVEVQNKMIQWVKPLIDNPYMQTFVGKNHKMKVAVDPAFTGAAYTPITQEFALSIANMVKKSLQLFMVVSRPD